VPVAVFCARGLYCHNFPLNYNGQTDTTSTARFKGNRKAAAATTTTTTSIRNSGRAQQFTDLRHTCEKTENTFKILQLVVKGTG